MSSRFARAVTAAMAFALCGAGASACASLLAPQYEYAEEIDLSTDGTAHVEVHASVAALVALRGAPLDAGVNTPVDRVQVRRLFEGPGVEVNAVRASRRAGRPFVHVELDAADIEALGRLDAFAWAVYEFERGGDVLRYRQTVGAPAGATVGDVGWTGDELVAFRLHAPSEIPFHNAPSRRIERGNILIWEQSLTDRLAGVPVQIEVHLEPESVLYRTLLLFGSTVLAAAAAFAVVIWRVARRRPATEG